MIDLIFYMKQIKLFFYGLKLFLIEILDYKKNNQKSVYPLEEMDWGRLFKSFIESLDNKKAYSEVNKSKKFFLFFISIKRYINSLNSLSFNICVCLLLLVNGDIILLFTNSFGISRNSYFSLLFSLFGSISNAVP